MKKILGGCLVGMLVLASAAVGQTRDVAFSVDMGMKINDGTFDPLTQDVEVRGDFNNWGNPKGTNLNRVGTTSIYSAVVPVAGAEGATVEYKFYITNLPGHEGWESIGNRSFNLGPAGTPQELDVVYFNNQGPVGPVGPEVTANVTFSVDMAVQIELGNFNQSTGVVQIRGPFNGWGGTALTREGETTIYSGTVSVTANEGAEVPHKFYIAGFANPDDGYENA
ncbi:MAG: hypothetical protein WBJ08_06265, partial [Kiritimatiellia bacterium]